MLVHTIIRTGTRGDCWDLLRFSEPEPDASHGQEGEQTDLTSGPEAGRVLRILIVEDNADAAWSLQELLRLTGHDARVAANGIEGVAAAQAFLPDVVLCDIGLPGMDGYEVARTVLSDPVTASARFIAVTGYGNPKDIQRSKQAGFEAHLTKPIDVDVLEALLELRQTGFS